jgi:hypothetical protein
MDDLQCPRLEDPRTTLRQRTIQALREDADPAVVLLLDWLIEDLSSESKREVSSARSSRAETVEPNLQEWPVSSEKLRQLAREARQEEKLGLPDCCEDSEDFAEFRARLAYALGYDADYEDEPPLREALALAEGVRGIAFAEFIDAVDNLQSRLLDVILVANRETEDLKSENAFLREDLDTATQFRAMLAKALGCCREEADLLVAADSLTSQLRDTRAEFHALQDSYDELLGDLATSAQFRAMMGKALDCPSGEAELLEAADTLRERLRNALNGTDALEKQNEKLDKQLKNADPRGPLDAAQRFPDGMKAILDEYRADVESLLEEHKRQVTSIDDPRYMGDLVFWGPRDTPRFNLNYGDLSVTDVWYRVDYEGDVTLVANIGEGDDEYFESWMASTLAEKWRARNYLVEVRTEW